MSLSSYINPFHILPVCIDYFYQHIEPVIGPLFGPFKCESKPYIFSIWMQRFSFFTLIILDLLYSVGVKTFNYNPLYLVSYSSIILFYIIFEMLFIDLALLSLALVPALLKIIFAGLQSWDNYLVANIIDVIFESVFILLLFYTMVKYNSCLRDEDKHIHYTKEKTFIFIPLAAYIVFYVFEYFYDSDKSHLNRIQMVWSEMYYDFGFTFYVIVKMNELAISKMRYIHQIFIMVLIGALFSNTLTELVLFRYFKIEHMYAIFQGSNNLIMILIMGAFYHSLIYGDSFIDLYAKSHLNPWPWLNSTSSEISKPPENLGLLQHQDAHLYGIQDPHLIPGSDTRDENFP